jgi:hypothetical protein
MNTRLAQISTGLFFATALVASANAEYRCAPAKSSIDRGACEAAEQGPDALRRYVHRMDRQMVNLRFSDYVDPTTERAWEEKAAAIAEQSNDAVKVAATQK